ncbi:hypothetical protein [Alteribacillus sp. HJP-4]|uniref:hypothetical protein n=1 Tax=Alteribacillus sp. HJP-4 TaxID=2775394 RepID=UPI0035CD154F
MKNYHHTCSSAATAFDTVQELLNFLLKGMVDGSITNNQELLFTIKNGWKSIKFTEFSSAKEYVLSLPSVMDEMLKVFHEIRNYQLVEENYINGVYIFLGISSATDGNRSSWMLMDGSSEKNQKVIYQGMRWLEKNFPKDPWELRAVHIRSAEKFIRMKRQYM